jgi:hypothetical protein
MSRIQSKKHPGETDESWRYARKADYEWEMAGLARVDGDQADELKHMERAREFERLALEARR